MAVGLGVLRLSPMDFWAMTPREFERAVSRVAGDRRVAPDRSVLTAMMRAFPDDRR